MGYATRSIHVCADDETADRGGAENGGSGASSGVWLQSPDRPAWTGAGRPAHVCPRPGACPGYREPAFLLLLGLRPSHDRGQLPPRMLDATDLDGDPLSGADDRYRRAGQFLPASAAAREDGREPASIQPRPLHPRVRRGVGGGRISRLRASLPLGPLPDRADGRGHPGDARALDAIARQLRGRALQRDGRILRTAP